MTDGGGAGVVVESVPGDWGVPSLSAHANAVLAYIRLSGNASRFTTRERGNILKISPSVSPVELSWSCLRADIGPRLTLGEQRPQEDESSSSRPQAVTGFLNIIDELRSKNCNLEEGLTDAQQADILAYTTMIERALAPALEYFLWLDGTNGSATTRPALVQHLTFPLPLLVPPQCVENAKHVVAGKPESELYGAAISCFSSLETKLGSKSFLFGNRPTMADALAFGYLTIILNAPMPNAGLAISLDTCPRLVHWCRQLEQLHFGKEHRDYRTRLKRKAEDEQKASGRRLQIGLSVAAAAALMVSYTFIMRRIPDNVVFLLQ